jgi:hypothetical protein
MKFLVSMVVASIAMTGCAAPQDENADQKPRSKVSATVPSAEPSVALAPAPGARTYPAPSPADPRVGQPFTAPVLSSGRWITARVTLVAIDAYTGPPRAGLDGTSLLFRWKATNVDDHPISAADDPVSYRFVALDDLERQTTPSGYASGTAGAPDGCTTSPARRIWRPGQTLRGCVVQTIRSGARLARAAFLCGDILSPQAAEFYLS